MFKNTGICCTVLTFHQFLFRKFNCLRNSWWSVIHSCKYHMRNPCPCLNKKRIFVGVICFCQLNRSKNVLDNRPLNFVFRDFVLVSPTQVNHVNIHGKVLYNLSFKLMRQVLYFINEQTFTVRGQSRDGCGEQEVLINSTWPHPQRLVCSAAWHYSRSQTPPGALPALLGTTQSQLTLLIL